MITVQGPSGNVGIAVQGQGASVRIIEASAAGGGVIETGPLPQVTVSDPGMDGRVTALEAWRDNGTINGGLLM